MRQRKNYNNVFNEQDLINVISAWESLPEGHYTPKQIENWLIFNMKPSIDNLRQKILNIKNLSENFESTK